MYFKKEKTIFDKFFNQRDALIIQYMNGDITKREFLQLNFDYIQRLRIEPFTKIDSYEKGMYNYQYYNMMAKYYSMMASDVKKRNKHAKYYNTYLSKSSYFYRQKDKSTLKLLKHLNFENIDAYFIKVRSKYLRNKLYEIVLKDYDNAILHSKSKWLLRILREEGVFTEGVKESLIDEYINEKY
ncbi:hypothetical protein BET03_12350 [Thermohalobacter berrensis]|uniref:Uncharacterized protein n=1 Tax=Thermohalobacter berrensis TaxID=99594 RepID=A0A419T2D5_9FIRM|nr:DUF6648 family protein [Thermohalobacter berrensis]RKD31578.1 hypothetical protein BET03_12350 [Thermohalobacter berrensis]